jgi:hypothetical protein
MDFLEPDREQAAPSHADLQRFLTSMSVEPAMISAPAIDELLATLRETHSNGGALFARWRLPADRVLHWYVSRNRLHEIPFFKALVSTAAVCATMPELESPSAAINELKVELVNSFALEGDIARVVHEGGAYTTENVDPGEAKRIAAAFCDSLIGRRFDEVLVYRTYQAWNDWFYDVAWDVTFLGIDKRDRTAWLLCATDTD